MRSAVRAIRPRHRLSSGIIGIRRELCLLSSGSQMVANEQRSRPAVMRIAQIAPLAESVPPKLYGGTERVVAWLVDELVSLGHEVTLFASGDSRTRGKLHPVWP